MQPGWLYLAIGLCQLLAVAEKIDEPANLAQVPVIEAGQQAAAFFPLQGSSPLATENAQHDHPEESRKRQKRAAIPMSFIKAPSPANPVSSSQTVASPNFNDASVPSAQPTTTSSIVTATSVEASAAGNPETGSAKAAGVPDPYINADTASTGPSQPSVPLIPAQSAPSGSSAPSVLEAHTDTPGWIAFIENPTTASFHFKSTPPPIPAILGRLNGGAIILAISGIELQALSAVRIDVTRTSLGEPVFTVRTRYSREDSTALKPFDLVNMEASIVIETSNGGGRKFEFTVSATWRIGGKELPVTLTRSSGMWSLSSTGSSLRVYDLVRAIGQSPAPLIAQITKPLPGINDVVVEADLVLSIPEFGGTPALTATGLADWPDLGLTSLPTQVVVGIIGGVSVFDIGLALPVDKVLDVLGRLTKAPAWLPLALDGAGVLISTDAGPPFRQLDFPQFPSTLGTATLPVTPGVALVLRLRRPDCATDSRSGINFCQALHTLLPEGGATVLSIQDDLQATFRMTLGPELPLYLSSAVAYSVGDLSLAYVLDRTGASRLDITGRLPMIIRGKPYVADFVARLTPQELSMKLSLPKNDTLLLASRNPVPIATLANVSIMVDTVPMTDKNIFARADVSVAAAGSRGLSGLADVRFDNSFGISSIVAAISDVSIDAVVENLMQIDLKGLPMVIQTLLFPTGIRLFFSEFGYAGDQRIPQLFPGFRLMSNANIAPILDPSSSMRLRTSFELEIPWAPNGIPDAVLTLGLPVFNIGDGVTIAANADPVGPVWQVMLPVGSRGKVYALGFEARATLRSGKNPVASAPAHITFSGSEVKLAMAVDLFSIANADVTIRCTIDVGCLWSWEKMTDATGTIAGVALADIEADVSAQFAALQGAADVAERTLHDVRADATARFQQLGLEQAECTPERAGCAYTDEAAFYVAFGCRVDDAGWCLQSCFNADATPCVDCACASRCVKELCEADYSARYQKTSHEIQQVRLAAAWVKHDLKDVSAKSLKVISGKFDSATLLSPVTVEIDLGPDVVADVTNFVVSEMALASGEDVRKKLVGATVDARLVRSGFNSSIVAAMVNDHAWEW